MQPAPPKLPPVSADMETVCTHGTSTTTSLARFFRDEMSRTRIEQGGMASIVDPLTGHSFVLNLVQKIAMPMQPKPPSLLGMPAMPAMPGQPNVPQAALQAPQTQLTKDLGLKIINGIRVAGKQFSIPPMPGMPGIPTSGMPHTPGMPAIPGTPPTLTSEVWMSADLHMPIQTSIMNPATGTHCVTEMKNVQPGASLPPSMFQVPSDFKVVTPAPPAQPPLQPPTSSLFVKK